MARKPKPAKGGNKKQPGIPSPNKGPKITADMMIADSHRYEDLMYKPNQVKSPEDMPVNEKFLEQLEIIKSLADVEISAAVLDKYNTIYGGHETYEECMQISHDNMVMVLLEALSTAIVFSDPDDPYDKGWTNLLKIIVSLYCGNPYTRDRIGCLMWTVAKHISPNCYFPLTLDLYYDPRLWHRPGQNPKPPLPIPPTIAFDGSGQEFGPEDDIWDCELPNTG